MDKILIISDTHGDIKTLEKIIKREKNYSYLLHLGDHHFDLDEVDIDHEKVNVIRVRGNCDFMKEKEEAVFTVHGRKIFMTHGHYYGVKNSLTNIFYKADEIGADIVLFGHTHEALNKKISDIHLFNPGSLSSMRSFGKISYGIMTIDDKGNYKLYHKTV
ncbi:metallophosphoesterase [uncultured Anaerofustis sp.]|uniref:metallophosphoesterase n=1 Tax=uncultured Anaerofustis sp. TaxID=904996 RepID=UPI0025E86311|nr:metallophosphoesterase [uncultured Anaerofustis sp.]